ncbi:alkaline phosphatase [Denitratimonas sp. CY0512]|uniref:alkaline phosphatase n=1 Tax=Denitratimonas sp. CY0512 TaxID=3131940 RepID=UPI0030ADE84A
MSGLSRHTMYSAMRRTCLLLSLLLSSNVMSAAPSAGHEGAHEGGHQVPPVPRIAHPHEETAAWWFHAGAEAAARNRGAAKPAARNVIIFIGDGMSIPTLAAARILEGQRLGASGEERRLSFEEFPHTALSRTYNTDSQTPDSAGTMSAITTGAKTRAGVISVGQGARRSDCASAQGQSLVTLMELAETAGMATGIVTTTRLTHATPAATFAHAPDRNWESDGQIPAAQREHGCTDIARQLIEFPYGDGLDLALGGGRRHFLPAGKADPQDLPRAGLRQDGRDLTAEWAAREGAVYVSDAAQLAAVDMDNTRQLLGLFAHDHLQFDHDRRLDARGEPSLAEMTRSAIEFLSRRSEGYVLMVEGGRIDHAHHYGNAYRALDDTVALSDAVRVATEMTSEQDTLILVTADHSHTLHITGYPERGNPILGLAQRQRDGKPVPLKDALGLPYTTLSYANGPGYTGASNAQPQGAKQWPHALAGLQAATAPVDLTEVDTTAQDFMQPSLVPLESETHGGDDVAVFARGPGAEAVRGSLEQNVLFHLIVQAQPTLRGQLCRLGACVNGTVPSALPDHSKLPATAR